MASERTLKNVHAERRLFVLRSVIAIAVGLGLIAILLARMAFLQLYQHGYYSTRSDDNRMRVQIVAPVRGLIFDRNGILLAENLPAYRVEIVPEQVEDLDDTLERLGQIIEIRDVDLERFHERRQRTPKFRGVPLRFRLSPEELARFEVDRLKFPGVDVLAGLTRHYPLGSTAAHLIGYVGGVSEQELARLDKTRYRGTSHIGKVGVEYSYEDILHGDPGSRIIEANAVGRTLRQLEYKRSKPGSNIYLTVDARLQVAAEQALDGKEGAVVAINPTTGGILALASRPNFDPSLFINGIDKASYQALLNDPDRPLFNRALQGQYPPGSTIKPIMALGGLENGVIVPTTRRYCPGFFRLPRNSRRYRCWKAGGHGSVDLNYSIMQSCDVYYYHLGVDLGIDNIHDFAARFGLGARTGVDLPREKAGVLPSRQWKRGAIGQIWFPGETLSVIIGQGYMTATPLQLAHATAQIAKRGRGMKPHVLHAVEDPMSSAISGVTSEPAEPIRLKYEGNWDRIIDAMKDVVHGPRGTALRSGLNAEYQFAGKTGTAQVRNMAQDRRVRNEDVEKRFRDHALFIAFAPVEEPQIAVAVLVEHGGSGSAAAAPIARQVLDAWLVEPQVEVGLEQPTQDEAERQ